MLKRAFDITVAIALLVPALLVLIPAAIAVRLESPGSPIFLQSRVGRDQVPFRLIKLRTMRIGTRIGASHDVGKGGITRVGAVLRRFKIDELPQLWSVLTGAMSLVGPRPCLPIQHELIAERDRQDVFAVQPGITGRAQVMGIDMSQPRRLAEIDGAYRRTRSFTGDIRIILQTVTGGGFYDAADVTPSDG